MWTCGVNMANAGSLSTNSFYCWTHPRLQLWPQGNNTVTLNMLGHSVFDNLQCTSMLASVMCYFFNSVSPLLSLCFSFFSSPCLLFNLPHFLSLPTGLCINSVSINCLYCTVCACVCLPLCCFLNPAQNSAHVQDLLVCACAVGVGTCFGAPLGGK